MDSREIIKKLREDGWYQVSPHATNRTAKHERRTIASCLLPSAPCLLSSQ